jgi:GcrA cell cycle regulator
MKETGRVYQCEPCRQFIILRSLSDASPYLALAPAISHVIDIMLSRNRPWTEEDNERLKAFVAKGASMIKVAAALRRTTISVRNRARSLGCPFPTLRAARPKWADAPDQTSKPAGRTAPPLGS